MSARLIKQGEHTSLVNFAPFVLPQETSAPRQSGTVTPFIPRAAGVGSAPTGTAAQPARLKNGQGAEAVNSHSDAESIIAGAQAEAARLVADAERRATQIEHEARERGLTEARAHAETEAARLIEPLRTELTRTIEEVAGLRTGIAERAERDLVKLAIEIAKKVVHREVTMDSEVALTLARVALTRIHNRAQAQIHLHPEDFSFVQKHLDRLPSGSSIELVEDRAVGRGGCLVETEMGDTDARIEQQFEELERSFLGV